MTSAEDTTTLFGRGAEKMRFPFFGHGHLYPVDARLSMFRDATRWAIADLPLTAGTR
jgi:hypothetical protein